MNQSNSTALIWFRNDLRLEDNPALDAAIKTGLPVIALYILEDGNTMGAASKWWLHHSLEALDVSLRSLGSKLILRKGAPLEILRQMRIELDVRSIFWNRRYEPSSMRQDKVLKTCLKNEGAHVESFCGNLLFEPPLVLNKSSKPFQVFTPFWKCLQSLMPLKKAISAPEKFQAYSQHVYSELLNDFNLLPKIHWDKGFYQHWVPGEKHAKQTLIDFISGPIEHYLEGRDFPAISSTAKLSAALHFGEISPKQVFEETLKKWPQGSKNVEGFLRQIGWREFAHHLLFHFQFTPTMPLREEFEHFPWVDNVALLQSWKEGKTGYPIVDAGMRELWHTGWMHNRVRMIVGSFLVKDLLIHWLEGAKWFWDTLVDADLANNTLGWQWIAGCGADAAPYFRIFNPVLQGEKFDPEGEYVKKWVPELSQLDSDVLHRPWEASQEKLRQAGITLGVNYPYPVVDHKNARDRALLAFKLLKEHK